MTVPNTKHKKTVAWLVSNCNVVNSNRNHYVSELQKYIKGVSNYKHCIVVNEALSGIYPTSSLLVMRQFGHRVKLCIQLIFTK